MLRHAIGSTPVLIGRKLKTSYHRGPNYLECTVDVMSNAAAARITSFAASAISTLSIALGFVLEGKVPEHLPEQLLGTVAIHHLELSAARHVDTAAPLQPRGAGAAAGGAGAGERQVPDAGLPEVIAHAGGDGAARGAVKRAASRAAA